jgi:hypothetical protein
VAVARRARLQRRETHLDWQRDDLFHVSFDSMAQFLTKRISRHFQFRQDYGLYEFTTYAYREAAA